MVNYALLGFSLTIALGRPQHCLMLMLGEHLGMSVTAKVA